MSESFERLGNYILLEKINAGGMAEVYLSKSIGANGINKFLAIKRILPQFADKPEFIEMFKEEAKIAVNLNHNNVVSIIDFKASQNQLYLVMEYVQGQNLRQILQQKKKKGLSLSLDFIVYVIREVAAGLDHAHRCVDKGTGKPLNIIHRDMSPQNIMISYDGEVKIVDFGIAKAEAAGESTRVGTLKGKFSYMSPEQAEGLVIDQSSDIFSIGIILWELIADDRLFVANNEMNILKRIKECDVPELRRVNPTVPAELERIVKKTLMKDKSLRYQSSTDLQKDLTRFLNKEYPDFTPGDFSTFMKFLFENEYSMAQERMVNYAKLDFGSLNELSEATQFTRGGATDFAVPPAPPKQGGQQPPPPPANFGFNEVKPPPPILGGFNNTNGPNPPDLPPMHRGETGLSGLQNAPTQINTTINKQKQVTLTGLTQNTGLRKQGNQPTPTLRKNNAVPNVQLATRSGVTSTGIRYRAPAKPPVSEFAKGIFTFIMVAVLCGGVYALAPKKVKNQINKLVIAYVDRLFSSGNTNIGSHVPPKESPTVPPKDPIRGTYNVIVHSDPGRARIFVNREDKNLTTPATLDLEANRTYSITLSADGYMSYTTKITPVRDGQEISATLTPVKYGYLDINVLNSGIDTIIYIDDFEIKDRPPISKRPVQADKPIKIRAVHNFGGTSAEMTVTVGAEEKKTIDLILQKNGKDSPENKK